ncbi:hypothetical protein SAMN05421853_10286 [Roseivivax halotolerans]|uniref:Uncharacterized protein n=1 Tax=Roseivivax halotolerans TaxID=93684 RepID=A0A1I5W2J7_9RHOB|nr:hypothetical protein [Roseivivax halotolerans]SFQ13893.1 hypothetical protein SAMN05421853_10286 [Roseivivax halotolerans]
MAAFEQRKVPEAEIEAIQSLVESMSSRGISPVDQIGLLANLTGRLSVVAATCGIAPKDIEELMNRNFEKGASEAHRRLDGNFKGRMS